jgi:hypothetical protein
MRLSCQKVFLLMLASTIGCHDPVAPQTLAAHFDLENINGRPLPTYFSPTPGLAPTILSASLSLDHAGKAVMTERRREFDGTETTYTNTFDYRIHGDQIEIGLFEPCPSNANCVGVLSGTISGQTLSLIIIQVSIDGSVTYNYRISPIL